MFMFFFCLGKKLKYFCRPLQIPWALIAVSQRRMGISLACKIQGLQEAQ